MKHIFIALLGPLFFVSVQAAEPVADAAKTKPRQLTTDEQAALPAAMRAQLPLHTPKGKPEAGEWLHRFEEPPENYRQFIAAGPIRATAARRTIYIQPLGEFTKEQRKIVELSREYLQCYFQLPVKLSDNLPLSIIPATARRDGPIGEQINSIHVLDKVLKPRLPKDAAVYLAFTASDLWPGDGWNFVFGQGSKQERVGVWSIHRFGDPTVSDEAFQLTLRRTLRTATHETGHMFSLPHCIYFECCMNGSNHLGEADKEPLWMCPQCQAKLCYATGGDPRKQLKELAAFAEKNGLVEEQKFWQRSIEAADLAKGK
jgi:archaemetzincin